MESLALRQILSFASHLHFKPTAHSVGSLRVFRVKGQRSGSASWWPDDIAAYVRQGIFMTFAGGFVVILVSIMVIQANVFCIASFFFLRESLCRIGFVRNGM